jgi:protocatechuate 3,4-dioxygenase beta subunit
VWVALVACDLSAGRLLHDVFEDDDRRTKLQARSNHLHCLTLATSFDDRFHTTMYFRGRVIPGKARSISFSDLDPDLILCLFC